MDFQVEIEYWSDSSGVCPVADFIEELSVDHQAWIFKRDEFFESMTMRDLMRTPYFGQVKGIKYPLWELKYSSSGGKNYRIVCFIWKRNLVGLIIFQGSGGGGKVNKFLKKAIIRAEDWKKRNPINQ